MRFSIGCIILVLFFASCVSNNENKTDSSDIRIVDGKEHVLTKAEKLEDYILALDSSDVNSVSKATAKFKELFEDKEDTLMNDQGVSIILDYLDKVSLYANRNVFDDKTNYESLVGIEFDGGKKSVPSELEAVYKAINSNGFRVRQSEGMFSLQQNPFYLQDQFYPYISSNFEIYLQQLGKENMEGYAEDAAIAIPYQSLVQRVIWWEDFSKATQNTVVGQEAKEQYNRYFTTLTIGMDNTPAIESEQIAAYFQDAYNYLEEFAPQSQTYQRLKNYIALLESEKIDSAKALVPGILNEQ